VSHRADFVDRQGVLTQLESVSCDGKTFFPLQHGEGTLMVPFTKAHRVTLGKESTSRVMASIEVDSTKRLDGSLPRSLLCTGATEYGNFQVEIGALEQIIFPRP